SKPEPERAAAPSSPASPRSMPRTGRKYETSPMETIQRILPREGAVKTDLDILPAKGRRLKYPSAPQCLSFFLTSGVLRVHLRSVPQNRPWRVTCYRARPRGMFHLRRLGCLWCVR